jgi:hypothetical protein
MAFKFGAEQAREGQQLRINNDVDYYKYYYVILLLLILILIIIIINNKKKQKQKEGKPKGKEKCLKQRTCCLIGSMIVLELRYMTCQ